MKLKIDKKHKYVVYSQRSKCYFLRKKWRHWISTTDLRGAVLRCVRLVQELFEFKIKLKREEDDHLDSIKNTVN